jgi:FMN reductase (NADPH)
MNDTIDLLLSHRSIRRYTDAPVPDEHVIAAVRAGQAASTSSAMQACHLVQVTDPAIREAIVPITGGQTKVARSGAFFVVCGDARRHRLACADHGDDYGARLEAFLVAVIDASLFAQNLCVAFESMGYGICYIGGLRNDLAEVDALLRLPDGVYPMYGLCAGVPDEAPVARPRLPLEAVLSRNGYPTDEEMRAAMADYDAGYAAYLEARGASPKAWTATMAAAHDAPRREALAAYYASKGADLG